MAIGEEVSSIVDYNTKNRDVYAIELTAGQEVVFALSGPSPVPTNSINVELVNPGVDSVVSGNNITYAFYESYVASGWRHTFRPAVSGTYYLVLRANHSSQSYTLSVAINQQ